MITIVNPPNGVSNKDTMGGLEQLYPVGAKNSFPPLDILYIAAVLRANAIPIQVIDCLSCNWDLSELIINLQDKGSEFISIRTSTPTFDWDMHVARIIKTVLKSKIVVFGPTCYNFPITGNLFTFCRCCYFRRT